MKEFGFPSSEKLKAKKDIDRLFKEGKWITTGEKVFKFERQFSKRFNVKHSHMVNSGSSANLVLIAALKRRFNWKDDDDLGGFGLLEGEDDGVIVRNIKFDDWSVY